MTDKSHKVQACLENGAHLQDRFQDLIDLVAVPVELLLAEGAQQLRVWPSVGEALLGIIHARLQYHDILVQYIHRQLAAVLLLESGCIIQGPGVHWPSSPCDGAHHWPVWQLFSFHRSWLSGDNC